MAKKKLLADAYPTLLTPAEVAALYSVTPKTVTRWANTGEIPSTRTPGGHRRFDEATILSLIAKSANTNGKVEGE